MTGYTLYTFFKSSTAWRVRIALHLKSIDAEHRYVHLFRGEQNSPEYKKINPNMGVPSLVLPSGETLYESMAIIEYLNELKPEVNNFFPYQSISSKAQIRAFCEVINSGIHPYQNLKLLNKLHADYGADRKKWGIEWITKGLHTIESMLERNSTLGHQKEQSLYTFGNQISAGDILFYPQVMAAKRRWGINLAEFKNIDRILPNLEGIPAFKMTSPEFQKDFQPQQK